MALGSAGSPTYCYSWVLTAGPSSGYSKKPALVALIRSQKEALRPFVCLGREGPFFRFVSLYYCLYRVLLKTVEFQVPHNLYQYPEEYGISIFSVEFSVPVSSSHTYRILHDHRSI